MDMHDPEGYIKYPWCPVCASPIDFCLGHGEKGDPIGARILTQHDEGNHSECHTLVCGDGTRL